MLNFELKIKNLKFTIVFLAQLFCVVPLLHAGQPDLEEQARQIAAELRCPVCQNLSAGDSPSELAQQMRAIILQQLKEGKSRDQIKAYFVSKYGEWVLLAPPAKGFSALLWVLPYLAVASGIVLVIFIVRRWSGRKERSQPEAVDPSLLARVKREAAMEAPPRLDPEDESPKSLLLREQGKLYADLRELEFDYQAGRLSEADCQEMRGKLEAEAALVLKKLEAAPPARSATAPKTPQSKPADKKAVEKQRVSRPAWQLVAGGAFLLLFGITIGVLLTRSVRSRGSEQDTITGDFLTGTGSEKDLSSLLGQGRAAFEKQDFPKAIDTFKKALAIDPNQPEAHAYMGLILAQAGHADGALLAFDKALSANPNFPLALWGKGMLLYQSKQDYAGAREALEKLSSQMPAGEEKNQIQKTLVEINEASKGQKPGPQKAKAESPPAQGQQIRGTISVDPKLKSKIDSKAVLFIVVYPAGSAAGPPLAVKKIDKPVFPLAYSLGQESVMMAGMPFSGKVSVSARLDKDGNAMTKQPGDLLGEHKGPVDVGSQKADIVLDQAM